MILKYAFYKTNKKIYFIRDIQISHAHWQIYCSEAQLNVCTEEKYYSMDKNTYNISDKQVVLPYSAFNDACFLNSHCFGCQYLKISDNSFEYQYDCHHNKKDYPNYGECGAAYCTIREYLNNEVQKEYIPQLFLNCQFKQSFGFYNELSSNKKVISSTNAKKSIKKVGATYFNSLSEYGVSPISNENVKFVKLKRQCLNPYQVNILMKFLSGKPHNRIFIADSTNSNFEFILEQSNNWDRLSVDYVLFKDFDIPFYYFLIDKKQRTLFPEDGCFAVGAVLEDIYICGNSETIQALKELE